MRAFWKGDASAAAMPQCLTASGEKFNRRGRRPWASVNFITAHDGFTLADLVRFNDKHNKPNGEDNEDGRSDNRSWYCGAEGQTEDADILALRARQQRNLLLSQGTPMLLAGDEFGRTQHYRTVGRRLMPVASRGLPNVQPSDASEAPGAICGWHVRPSNARPGSIGPESAGDLPERST